MSFTRLQNEAKLATERAFDRYVALLQQEEDWTAEQEAEMKGICLTLGKTMPEMAADRQVIARVRELQQAVAEGADSSAKRKGEVDAFVAFNAETDRIAEERRAEQLRRYGAIRKLSRSSLEGGPAARCASWCASTRCCSATSRR